MFLSNKYTNWYYAIIHNANARSTNGYHERHHIIPKSLGGDNYQSNIAMLTAREHFICHKLLTKMLVGKHKQKMCFALQQFMRTNQNHQRRILSRDYAWARRQISEAMSALHKGKVVSAASIEKFKLTRERNNKRRSTEAKLAQSVISLRMWDTRRDELLAVMRTPDSRRKKSSSAIARGMHENTIKTLNSIHISNKGSGNPRARRISITSPSGDVYEVCGEFKQFCNDHDLPFSTMNCILNGRIFSTGRAAGWIAVYMD